MNRAARSFSADTEEGVFGRRRATEASVGAALFLDLPTSYWIGLAGVAVLVAVLVWALYRMERR